MREMVNGVRVLRTYLYVPKNPRSTLRRILFDSSFALSALVSIFNRPRPDVIVIISPPLQLVLTALVIAFFRRAPVFMHIQDLVPDAAIAVGALRPDGTAVQLAQALERLAYRKASGIGVICEGMRQNLLAKGVPMEKVTLLPDYIDLDSVGPISANNAFRARHGIPPGEFLVVYSGSVGGKQGLETFVEAAVAFEETSGITCCLIGDGPYLLDLKRLARHLSLQKFRFVPLQPREALPEQLCAADVLVITQRKSISDMVFPGKLLYYMASRRAILAAVSENSETGRFILENKVGLVVPPEDPERFADAIRWMRAHPERIRALGEKGREVVGRHFDRTTVLERFTEHLETFAKS